MRLDYVPNMRKYGKAVLVGIGGTWYWDDLFYQLNFIAEPPVEIADNDNPAVKRTWYYSRKAHQYCVQLRAAENTREGVLKKVAIAEYYRTRGKLKPL